jgi:hypothetical protein
MARKKITSNRSICSNEQIILKFYSQKPDFIQKAMENMYFNLFLTQNKICKAIFIWSKFNLAPINLFLKIKNIIFDEWFVDI